MSARTRAERMRFRDQLASVIFFAAGLYVVLVGVLGFAGHPRGVAPDIGPGMYWFTYVVSGCALLAGGVLVLRRGRPPKTAWWLVLIAAVPGCLLWLWGVATGLVQLAAADSGASATSELVAFGVLVGYALLFWLGWRRVRRAPTGGGKAAGPSGESPPAGPSAR
jgi:lysylphosphatidylglycerol synthetase-like protein (DUF2156 family)